jgi:hypothetical protein
VVHGGGTGVTSDVELAIASMEAMGFEQVVTLGEVSGGGASLDALGGAAWVGDVTIQRVHQVRGAAGSGDALLYTRQDVAADVVGAAERRDVAVFRFEADGAADPRSTAAHRLARRGQLGRGPALQTDARAALHAAIQDYAQTVADICAAWGDRVEEALEVLRDEVDDAELARRVAAVASGSRVLADVLGELDGETTGTIEQMIARVERAETLVHDLSDLVGIDYGDLETDVLLASITRRRDG